MRIIFFSTAYPDSAAPQRGSYNAEMCRSLAVGHDVEVICPRPWWQRQAGSVESLEAGHAVRAEYPRFCYPPRILRGLHGQCMWWSVRSTIRRVAQRFKPDCMLSYWSYPDTAAALRAAKHLTVPLVAMVGGSDVLLLAQSASIRRRVLDALHGADAVVAVSANIERALVDLGLPAKKVHLIYRGVDSAQFFPGDRQASRSRLGIAADERVLLWAGRMVPVKGLDVLLDACRLLQKRDCGFSLYLVGDGPLRRELTMNAAGLAERVHFVGPVAHAGLADWYRAADLTVLPSRSEGVPNVLIESHACGTPFVASRVGGIPEITSDDHDRLVPPDDAPMLAEAIASALDHASPDRSRLSQRVPTLTDSAELLLDVMRRLAEQRGRSVGRSRLTDSSVCI